MVNNKKLVLVNPGRYLYAYPPLGLGYLSSYLKKYSNFVRDVFLVDENAKDDVEQFIRKNKPKIVAITATTPQIVRAHEIAKFCKKMDRRIICIIGGVHCTVLPRKTLKEFSCFDIGVYGEGEETFKELVDKIFFSDFDLFKIDFSKIKGLVYRRGKRIFVSKERGLIKNLDKIPPPDRHLFNLRYYRRPRQAIRGISCRAIQIMSSRGCPYNCRFCSSSLMWRRKVRFHSAERFIKEVRELASLGFNGFYLHDDTFIVDKERVRKICQLLLKTKLAKKMIWAAQIRVDLIQSKDDLRLLRLMKKAGCLQVEYGFESGSQRVLSFLKRNTTTIKQAEKAIKITKEAGLRIFGNFMIGAQGETREDVIKTKKFILKNSDKLDYYQVYVATPYPGTELWDLCKKKRLLKGITWEKFGMGILDNFVFSNTVDHDFIHQTIRELSRRAVEKITIRDKLKWLLVRSIDDPGYVFSFLKEHFKK
jgi:radical SAM superfamily enzyme YgiQ (UPF0313 family)